MTQLKVLPHIAGSYVVVQFDGDHYLDARKWRNGDEATNPRSTTCLEMVRNGQVYWREQIANGDAPGRITEIMRDYVFGMNMKAVYAN